jgi:hypothetical protein
MALSYLGSAAVAKVTLFRRGIGFRTRNYEVTEKFMATGREQRKKVALTVRIFGTDSNGRIFSDSVSTVNVSFEGAMLSGVHRAIQTGDVIGLTYGSKKARFRVKWVGKEGSPYQGNMGLQAVAPASCIWDVPLQPRAEATDPHYSSPRRTPRVRCTNSIQLNPTGQPPVWSKVADISEGGCFVEMMLPLETGTRLKISLWLKDDKVVAEGVVAHARPAYGVGIQFTEMSTRDAERLREFLKSMVRFPAEPVHADPSVSTR